MRKGSIDRVLLTTEAVGDVWMYTLDLARAIPGVSFTAAVLGPRPDAEQMREAGAIANLRVEPIGGSLEWMDDPWEDVDLSAVPLLALAEEVRPDVVHLNDYSSGALAWEAPTLVVGHSCALSWWEAVRGERAPERYAEYRRRVSAGLAGADAVAAPSAWMLGELRRHYGPLPAARVVHGGTGLSPGERTERGPFQWPVVLAAGRGRDEAGNIAVLVAEAPRLDAEVWVAGVGRELPVNVRDLGRLSRGALAEAMSGADIFVHAARYEPFGLTAVEAAVRGCALVLGDTQSLREVWGDAAVYVDPSDGLALRNAVELLSDAGVRRRWAERARERARRYTLAHMAAGYAELYAGLAKGSLRARSAR